MANSRLSIKCSLIKKKKKRKANRKCGMLERRKNKLKLAIKKSCAVKVSKPELRFTRFTFGELSFSPSLF